MVAPLGKLATDDLKEYQAWRVGGCISIVVGGVQICEEEARLL
jgi:hypothetical protein